MLKLMVPTEASTGGAGCKDVACPKPETCPDDSTLKLVTKHHTHHHHQLSSNAKDINRRKRALVYGGRQRETIKIIPGAYDHHSRKRSITDDELLLLHCCPQYECVCKPNYCDQQCPGNKIPANNTTHPTEQFGVPGSCCAPCRDSYCMHEGRFRKHGEKWQDDECTECECEFGRPRCLVAMCEKPNCLNYKQVPGECCPVCDEDESNFCGDVRYCGIMCKYGYLRQGDCDLCECARPPSPNGSTVSYPEVQSTTSATATDELGSVEDIIRKGPQQNSAYGGIDYHFWITLLSCLVPLSIIIACTVWCCYSRKSVKYNSVEIPC